MMTDYPAYSLDQLKVKVQDHTKISYPVAVRATRRKFL